MVRYFKSIIIFIRLIRESLAFSISSIVANKMRTFLSLLGVTIGIFAIISMFTVIDSLEKNLTDSLSKLGSSDVIYIQKYPWVFENNHPWWKYRTRPSFTYNEYTHLQKNAKNVSFSTFEFGFYREVKYKSKVATNAFIYSVTHDFDKIMPLKLDEGRYFSVFESANGNSVAIIGAKVVEELFGLESAIGKDLRIGGRTTRIIGTLEKEGDNMFQINNLDEAVLIPYQYARTLVNVRYAEPYITIKAKPGVSNEEMGYETQRLLRAQRRIKPLQDNNFALNEMSMIKEFSSKIFGTITAVGWIIGLFSIIVGAFGIANIMFVSVKERTSIIGVQKALGAKGYFILTQFLFEAAFLAVMGGIIGLLLIWGGAALISSEKFTLVLTMNNIILGITISAIVGIVSGFIPAYVASRLDPVVAINSK